MTFVHLLDRAARVAAARNAGNQWGSTSSGQIDCPFCGTKFTTQKILTKLDDFCCAEFEIFSGLCGGGYEAFVERSRVVARVAVEKRRAVGGGKGLAGWGGEVLEGEEGHGGAELVGKDSGGSSGVKGRDAGGAMDGRNKVGERYGTYCIVAKYCCKII